MRLFAIESLPPVLREIIAHASVIVATLLLVNFAAVGQSREAVNQQQHIDIADKVIKEFGEVNVHGAPCQLDVHHDLPGPDEPQPLYLIPGSVDLWLPNADGKLIVPRGSAIELHCPNKGLANISNSDISMPRNTLQLRVTCVDGQTFTWGKRLAKAEFARFVCRHWPKYRVERLAENCGARAEAQLYRVGFNLTQSRFVESARLCHADDNLRAIYARYQLSPASVHFQRNVKRLDFSKAGGHFLNQNMQQLYTQRQQHLVAERLYGEPYDRYVNDKSLFLARGHLAAKSDMIYANQQRSTFSFYNVAPQWQTFNGGLWAALEDQVRKFIARSALLVDCYTGAWGTLTLPGDDGVQREFYFARDDNNNGLLPVPQLFYRVIFERAAGDNRRGLALVGVNNPHASLEEIRSRYVLCEDVREQVPWLRRLRNDNLRKGYVYACSVADLASVVDDLPRELLTVRQLLVGA